jgi:amino acid permease
MQFIKKNMTVIIVLCVAVVAFYIYSAYFSAPAAPLLSTADQSPASQSLLLTLTSLQSIKLDPAIFSDPVFQSLTDFGVTIPPQTPGRSDPFAPPGTSIASGASASSTTGQ